MDPKNGETLEILLEIGVDYCQGLGIGKKMPLTELLKWALNRFYQFTDYVTDLFCFFISNRQGW